MLGKLKRIDLRNVWKNEQTDFAPWLAKDENIKELGDKLEIDNRVIKTEAEIGEFNIDILAEDSVSENKIIIENQLDTNHDHLGKLITYSARVRKFACTSRTCIKLDG